MASFIHFRPHREVRPPVLGGGSVSRGPQVSLSSSSRQSLAQVLSCAELDAEGPNAEQPSQPSEDPSPILPHPLLHSLLSSNLVT